MYEPIFEHDAEKLDIAEVLKKLTPKQDSNLNTVSNTTQFINCSSLEIDHEVLKELDDLQKN